MTEQNTRKQILQWGGISIVIYLLYVLIFPLIPYIYVDGNMLDLEMILRKGARWLIWLYIFGLVILFYSFYKITKLVHEFSKQNKTKTLELRKTILGIGITSSLVLLFLYPITALDVAVYVINARNWVLYGGNPLTTPPETFPNDEYIHLAGEYASKTSPYGPVWEMIGSVPVRLGITDIAHGIMAMKIISLLAYIFMAWLIGWKSDQKNVSPVTALTFFALNPLVLLETIGNAHNEMTMIAFVTFGLILYQKNQWVWASVAFTIASLIKLPALIILPLFGIALLQDADSWRTRFIRALTLASIFLSLFFACYSFMGNFPDVFQGVLDQFVRRSFSPAYALHVIVREFNPEFAKAILANTRNLFLLIYAIIMIQFLRKKLTFLEAGFLAYFVQIYLTNAFRIWYPLWLIPFATLNLNSKTYWRIFLFSAVVQFSILSYYILWRWHWRYWEWGLTGPLAEHWDYFKIMTPFTVSWTFTLPFLGDLIGRMRDKAKFDKELWL